MTEHNAKQGAEPDSSDDHNGVMLPWLGLSAGIALVDQLTKVFAERTLEYAQPVEVTFFFNLTLLYNTGAAFSFLSDGSGWQRWFFIVVALGMGCFILAWLWKLRRSETWLAVALALVLGGAVGNLWDRVTLGYVVDFISVHYQSWYFPAFNIADSAITIGAVMLILDTFLTAREPVKDE